MIIFLQAFWSFFLEMLSVAAANAPGILVIISAIGAVGGLYFITIRQGHRMELGFTKLRGEMNDGFVKVYSTMDMRFAKMEAQMKEGFLKVNHRLDNHDRDIKHVKKRIRKLEKQVSSHHLMLIRKLDQPHQR
jgi:hypothetical protein